MRNPVLKVAYAAVLVAGVAYAFVELRGPSGVGALLQRRSLVHQYEIENQNLNREIQQHQDRIQRLDQNPTEQEFEIRQRLKLAKPGEKIYILEPDSKK